MIVTYLYPIIIVLSCAQHLLATNIAITIDDYPLPDNRVYTVKERTQRFIDIANQHNCKLAFFCIGQHIEDRNDPSLLQMLDSAGHFIANHSMHHRYLSSMPLKEFKQEIVLADTLITPYSTTRKWFRYPYLDYGNKKHLGGSTTKLIGAYALLYMMGFAEGYVTINTFDWYINKRLLDALKNAHDVDYQALKNVYLSLLEEWISHYINLYQSELGFEVVHTLLLHDNSLNALYFEEILTMIKKNGWNIVSPEIAFQDTSWRKKFFFKAAALSRKPQSLNCDEIDKQLEIHGAL